MTLEIKAPISVGELIDKITILEIKSEKIKDSGKLKNIQVELKLLDQLLTSLKVSKGEVLQLKKQLKIVNFDIWQLEDSIRDHERDKNFDCGFVDLARKVYKTNDKRAAFKNKINILVGSVIVEEKSYQEYD
ncbi:DUF6165 family protein [Lentilitoribacter sp. Alg239-R112]|uniref:DUF6165 family protein n=1 Tax=Lentilitoribacter sp. Alg239-R112 TaxID=2305987 RepID=UPI0013A696B3|nr:DUF6165 family protein [Lentilitoribacter sp. Alg239-R112]